MKRVGVAGFFCVLFLVTLAADASAEAPAEAPAETSNRGLVLRPLDGEPVYVDSLLLDGPVVLNFWATWCKPCRLEMPQIEKLYKELEPKGVHFAAISLDSRRSEKVLIQYLQKYKMSVPVYWDPDGKLGRPFKVGAIPTTVVLDKEGRIHHRTRGYRPGDEVLLKKKIEGLIKSSEEPAPDAAEK
ncbi:MAG: TlpA disulfide reductase family protein [Candidatus Eisenbacteria bacterium]